LKPENTFILGKSYSTNREVAKFLQDRGVYIHPHSSSFNSHESWDAQFKNYVSEFIKDVLSKINDVSSIRQIIIVDDGGFIIEQINQLKFSQKIQCVEWTSSGYRKLLNLKLHYPVLNIARSKTKLDIESPIIGSGVVQKVTEQYPDIIHSSKKALIIGAGPIGLAVKKSLEKTGKNVDVIDVDTPISELNMNLFDVVIGCTGESVLGENNVKKLGKVLLVSASSSDKEFSAMTIREHFPRNTDPHKDYLQGEVTLSNSGFPINFDGRIQFLPLEKIQITLGLIFSGICLTSSREFSNGLNDFPTDIGNEITDDYLVLSRQNN
jgi:S-adenosylhomocysteine hydrolase